MKVYIAGKISGLPWPHVVEKFKAASSALKSFGHVPLCPTEMFPENPVWDWAEYMLADLRLIWHHADCVWMLPDWEESKGASLEHHAAVAVGKPVYYRLDDLLSATGNPTTSTLDAENRETGDAPEL